MKYRGTLPEDFIHTITEQLEREAS
jgi:hypothetical protein